MMFLNRPTGLLFGVGILFASGLGCGSADRGPDVAVVERISMDDGAQEEMIGDLEHRPVVVNTADKEVVEEVDPESISAENDGFYVDMDDDGENDFVILDGDDLIFQKGLGEDEYGPRQQIARLEESVDAYSVKSAPEMGIHRASFFIYKKVDGKDSLQGFVQRNFGLDADGRIMLSEPESLSKEDFDF